MVAWFLTAILTVGLFAYISLTGVSLVANTQGAGQRTEAVRRLDAVVQGLQSQSAAPLANGVVYAPAGTVRNGVYGLPQNLLPVGIDGKGGNFVYCPMGNGAVTMNGSVPSNGGSYDIMTAELNDKTYVVAGRTPTAASSDPNVIAFVIAPSSQDAAQPGCNAVVQSGDGYTVPNGVVRALRRTSVTDVDSVRENSGNIWYVSPNGTGNGQSPGTPGSLTAAANAYRNSLGGSFTIVLAGGNYTSDSAILDQTQTAMLAKKENSALILTSPSAAAIRVAGSITVPGNLELKNIDLAGTITYAETDRYLRSANSNLGPVIAKQRSRVVFSGNNVIIANNAATAALYQNPGSTFLASQGTLSLLYLNGKFAWKLENGAVGTATGETINVQPADSTASSIQQNSMISAETQSQVVFKGVSLNINGNTAYALGISGRFTALDSNLNMNAPVYVALQTGGSARVTMMNSTIRGTSPATYGISAIGASSFVGYGDVYSSNRCWFRGGENLFRYSNVGVTGQNSILTTDEVPPGMSAQPTAIQVKRYQGVVYRNVERSNMRNGLVHSNTGFTCKQASPPVYTTCAAENAYCNMPEYSTVRYGAGSTFYYRQAGKEGIPCDNATWGDPLTGTVKQCQYLS